MPPDSPAQAIVSFGSYGAGLLARIWMDADMRTRLESCGVQRWIINEFSLDALRRNTALAKASLNGADFEVNIAPEPFALPAHAQVVAGLGGQGGQWLGERSTAGALAECHLHVLLPFDFESRRSAAKRHLDALRSPISQLPSAAASLSLIDSADYCRHKMSLNQANEQILATLQHKLLHLTQNPG